MIVAGDRAVLHDRFRGHFTGTFEGRRGEGQPIVFVATDIYRAGDGGIVANLALLRQFGAIPTP